MSVKKQVSKALSVVLPGGSLGASIVLALMAQTPAAEAAQVASQPDGAGSVSARLAEIRSGVTAMPDANTSAGSADPAPQGQAELLPTWWGNGGWGRWGIGWGNGGWPNWHNWGNGGWHNWGNGGWHNWGNGWHNFWHNW
jgi:rSAM-associated Gly-rich repeat protein